LKIVIFVKKKKAPRMNETDLPHDPEVNVWLTLKLYHTSRSTKKGVVGNWKIKI